MTAKLQTPILDGARHPHYFPGRLLSARDLRDEQEAQHRHHRHLGRAVGTGVVEGLWVEEAGEEDGRPALSIAAGLALDREGTALELRHGVRLALTRASKTEAEGSVFSACRKEDPDLLLVGAGFYLLTLSPVVGFAERAPASGLAEDGAELGCGSRYRVDGVQLDLVRLDPASLPGVDAVATPLAQALAAAHTGTGSAATAALSRVRNLMAHLIFGTPARAAIAADPFARQTPPQGGPPISTHLHANGLASLYAEGKLLPCQVPLALLYWTSLGLRYVDPWAVRRRPEPVPVPDPAADPVEALWAFATPPISRTLVEARFLHFQSHLDALLAEVAASESLRASDYFHYLPPSGYVPVAAGSSPAVRAARFFAGVPYREDGAGRPEYLDARKVPALLEAAAPLPPIRLAAASAAVQNVSPPEMVWVYRMAVPTGSSPARAEGRYLVFGQAFLPPMNTARFDIARWDSSNHTNGSSTHQETNP
ncbi:MAG: hypothetical protein MI919_36550 [Holophagales bacterium]|nr:hypothetical protein [Holophagales bacterium]